MTPVPRIRGSRNGECVHSYLQSFKDAPINICVEPSLGDPVAPRVFHAVDGQAFMYPVLLTNTRVPMGPLYPQHDAGATSVVR